MVVSKADSFLFLSFHILIITHKEDNYLAIRYSLKMGPTSSNVHFP